MSCEYSVSLGSRVRTSFNLEEPPFTTTIELNSSKSSGASSNFHVGIEEEVGDHDESVKWNEDAYTPNHPASTIKFQGKLYRCRPIFEGGPRGMPTRVFYAEDEEGVITP